MQRRLFEENQSFAPVVIVLMLASIVAMCLPPMPPSGRIVPIAVMLLIGNLLFEKTVVTNEHVRVQFGYLVPLYVRTIALDDVTQASTVTYSPIGEYGGWGIRGFGSRVALNARGNRGVLLTLQNRGTVLIGSQRPEELAAAIEAAKKN